MKKLALFDLDGTLFNTNDANYFAYNTALEEYGYSINYEYYSEYCNGRHYTVFLPNILNNDEELIEEIHNRKKELYHTFLNKVIVNEHLFNIIESIKKEYYVAIVTTASRKNTFEILDYFRKKELFDLILTQEDISKPKPNPEGFVKAMNYFNIEPKDTLIFEDSPVGIEAANKSGGTVFVVNKF